MAETGYRHLKPRFISIFTNLFGARPHKFRIVHGHLGGTIVDDRGKFAIRQQYILPQLLDRLRGIANTGWVESGRNVNFYRIAGHIDVTPRNLIESNQMDLSEEIFNSAMLAAGSKMSRKNMFEGIPAEDMPLAILVAFAILILLIVLVAVIISFL